jgi:hypothetical protein
LLILIHLYLQLLRLQVSFEQKVYFQLMLQILMALMNLMVCRYKFLELLLKLYSYPNLVKQLCYLPLYNKVIDLFFFPMHYMALQNSLNQNISLSINRTLNCLDISLLLVYQHQYVFWFHFFQKHFIIFYNFLHIHNQTLHPIWLLINLQCLDK